MLKSLTAALLLGAAVPATAQIGFTLPAQAPAAPVTALEYYIDADPGAGNGNPIPVTPGMDVTAIYPLNISALSKGLHHLYVRSGNAAGHWSTTLHSVFVIYSKVLSLPASAMAASPVTAAEYFVDTDPGTGAGTAIPVTTGADVTAGNIAVNVSGLGLGIHRAFFRARNADGQWSTITRALFTIINGTISTLPANAAGKPITRLEYYLDTDPGYGNGAQLTVAPAADLTGYNFTVDVSTLAAGNHTLFVRSLDGISVTQATGFTIGTVTPLPVKWLSFNARQQADSVLLQWATADDAACTGYGIERSQDGRSFKQIGAVAAHHPEDIHSYAFTDEHPATGINYYRLKEADKNGTSSYSPVVTVRLEAAASLSINNPVQGTLIVRRIGQGAAGAVTVTNTAGAPVMNIPLSDQAIQMADVSALAPGIYLLQWNSGDQAKAIRFVKQ